MCLSKHTEAPYYAIELDARGEGKAEAENPFLITRGWLSQRAEGATTSRTTRVKRQVAIKANPPNYN